MASPKGGALFGACGCFTGGPQASAVVGSMTVVTLRDGVRREAAPARMFPHKFLIGRVVDAVHLVARHIALHPLHVGSQFLQHAAGFLGNGLQLGGLEGAESGDGAFDDEFGHKNLR
jgi:hypothetical protein